MPTPVDELVRFLRNNGVGPWVADAYGCAVRVEDWAERFVDTVSEEVAAEAYADAARLQDLRDRLAERPDQKTITIKKIREVIDA